MSQKMRGQESDVAAETGTDFALFASVVSVAMSLYAFFGRGDRELGIFIGLWAPTILTLANHFKQRQFEQRLKMIPIAPSASNVRETIEDLLSSSQ